MNPPVTVLLVRHGRTLLNAEGRLRGLANPELDETGVAQAHETAVALVPRKLTRVLSSPLHRAATTAEVIAAESGLTNTVDPSFNDRDYGPWTGHIKDEVIKEWGSVDAAPGVEDLAVVRDRAMPALQALAEGSALAESSAVAETTPSVIAIVTHDAVIRPILTAIQPGITAEVENGTWAEISWDGSGWSVVSVDNAPDSVA